jgi:hypothetical protein
VGVAWEELPAPHPPRLWPEDVDLTHGLWLDLIDRGAGDELRHRDVVSVALRRLKRELQTEGEDVLRDVVATVREHGPDKVVGPVKAADHNHR